jgi:hypothetical protein
VVIRYILWLLGTFCGYLYILLLFCTFCDYLVYCLVFFIWNIFPVLVNCREKNLATLLARPTEISTLDNCTLQKSWKKFRKSRRRMKRNKLFSSVFFHFTFFFLKSFYIPYTLAGFDLTAHSSSLLGG